MRKVVLLVALQPVLLLLLSPSATPSPSAPPGPIPTPTPSASATASASASTPTASAPPGVRGLNSNTLISNPPSPLNAQGRHKLNRNKAAKYKPIEKT